MYIFFSFLLDFTTHPDERDDGDDLKISLKKKNDIPQDLSFD